MALSYQQLDSNSELLASEFISLITPSHGPNAQKTRFCFVAFVYAWVPT
jgi:hypothetical protein